MGIITLYLILKPKLPPPSFYGGYFLIILSGVETALLTTSHCPGSP
jgi:hypothetical protein